MTYEFEINNSLDHVPVNAVAGVVSGRFRARNHKMGRVDLQLRAVAGYVWLCEVARDGKWTTVRQVTPQEFVKIQSQAGEGAPQ